MLPGIVENAIVKMTSGSDTLRERHSFEDVACARDIFLVCFSAKAHKVGFQLLLSMITLEPGFTLETHGEHYYLRQEALELE